MLLKFKKLSPAAVLPTRAREGDAGLDITAIMGPVPIYAHDYVEYHTGLAVEIPLGHVGLLFQRSSVSNKALSLCNAVGVIDSGYRGEITFRFRQLGSNIYQQGDKIGQLVVLPIDLPTAVEVLELSDSSRGSGGYGSTGQ